MVTEMITLKLDNSFLKDIDLVVKNLNYQSRTELIREALRDKLEKIKVKQAMLEISKFKGIMKNKNHRDYELVRRSVFEELCSK